MDPLNFPSYFLIAMITYTGLALGAMLSFRVQEELALGKKWFMIIRKLIYIGMVGTSIYFLYESYLVMIVIFLALISAYYSKIFYKPNLQFFFAVLFFVAARDQTFFVIIAITLFLLNMLTATVWVAEEKKDQGDKKELPKARRKMLLKGILTKNLVFFLCILLHPFGGLLP